MFDGNGDRFNYIYFSMILTLFPQPKPSNLFVLCFVEFSSVRSHTSEEVPIKSQMEHFNVLDTFISIALNGCQLN